MPKCEGCQQQKPSYMNVTVNGVRHDWCEQCWKKQRETFLRALNAGDPKAQRIFDAVAKAVLRQS